MAHDTRYYPAPSGLEFQDTCNASAPSGLRCDLTPSKLGPSAPFVKGGPRHFVMANLPFRRVAAAEPEACPGLRRRPPRCLIGPA
jgi:hypothetical protein